MELFGLTITRTRRKSASHLATSGTWWPLIREPFTGAWQSNQEVRLDSVLQHPTVYACVTLIASDIGKMRPMLLFKDARNPKDIPTEVENSAYSPVLRTPNHYQEWAQFQYWWIVSKLVHGNAYALKKRNGRGGFGGGFGNVDGTYLLDPHRVRVVVADDGSVFYQLSVDNLSGIEESVMVPSREMMHDVMDPLFHPLCGVSPLYAAGLIAMLGLDIIHNSRTFFANGSQPGAILMPEVGQLSQAQATDLKTQWETQFTGDNAGKVAILGDKYKYQALSQIHAHDAQLTEQLNWIDEKICSAFHVPPHKVGVGDQPNYNNIEALNQQYYAECLQKLITSMQLVREQGLELTPGHLIRLNPHDLLYMDTATKSKAAQEGVRAGVLAPNEARRIFFDLPPVPGGNTPYLQQQDFSLEALARRDANEPAPNSLSADEIASAAEEDATESLEAE